MAPTLACDWGAVHSCAVPRTRKHSAAHASCAAFTHLPPTLAVPCRSPAPSAGTSTASCRTTLMAASTACGARARAARTARGARRRPCSRAGAGTTSSAPPGTATASAWMDTTSSSAAARSAASPSQTGERVCSGGRQQAPWMRVVASLAVHRSRLSGCEQPPARILAASSLVLAECWPCFLQHPVTRPPSPAPAFLLARSAFCNACTAGTPRCINGAQCTQCAPGYTLGPAGYCPKA